MKFADWSTTSHNSYEQDPELNLRSFLHLPNKPVLFRGCNSTNALTHPIPTESIDANKSLLYRYLYNSIIDLKLVNT